MPYPAWLLNCDVHWLAGTDLSDAVRRAHQCAVHELFAYADAMSDAVLGIKGENGAVDALQQDEQFFAQDAAQFRTGLAASQGGLNGTLSIGEMGQQDLQFFGPLGGIKIP